MLVIIICCLSTSCCKCVIFKINYLCVPNKSLLSQAFEKCILHCGNATFSANNQKKQCDKIVKKNESNRRFLSIKTVISAMYHFSFILYSVLKTAKGFFWKKYCHWIKEISNVAYIVFTPHQFACVPSLDAINFVDCAVLSARNLNDELTDNVVLFETALAMYLGPRCNDIVPKDFAGQYCADLMEDSMLKRQICETSSSSAHCRLSCRKCTQESRMFGLHVHGRSAYPYEATTEWASTKRIYSPKGDVLPARNVMSNDNDNGNDDNDDNNSNYSCVVPLNSSFFLKKKK
ncbi:hypothetical protein RFI_00301 [Reticulomyxa filosa]|uniref:Uncharacterized protein n=1 Tax=Reticulomyxa filosa TaxID=46433 RepID=X6PEX8_RETFI|nr:hypothetical protein RFI_00301 [Reticulomyxa filosa]|eukprot:ETO36761.1 hypothetical protein RFI_00301 [Reticulomyxa filosa]